MEVREALLKTATLFTDHPEVFNFKEVQIPGNCGSPGCALGYIGFFLGMTGDDQFISGSVCEALGIESTFIFESLTKVYGNRDWYDSAAKCAEALRMYADVHHPEIKKTTRKDMPEKVRKIFDKIFAVA